VTGETPTGADSSAYDVIRREVTSISDSGLAAFDAELDGSFSSDGTFVDGVAQGGSAIAFCGDDAPGSGGGCGDRV
jgi:hypothetical protein